MKTEAELLAELRSHVFAARTIADLVEIEERDFSDDERKSVEAHLDKIHSLDKLIAKVEPIMKDLVFGSQHETLRERHQQKWFEVLCRHYERQEAVITSRVPAAVGKTDIGGVWWDDERWNNELAVDLLRLNNLTAMAWAEYMIEQTGADIEDMQAFQARMLPWLQEHSTIQATYINSQTRDAVTGALREVDPLQAVKDLFAAAITVWAVRQAIGAVTTASNFGSHEAASAGNLRRKRWRVNSRNPRDSHQAMDGETVGIRDLFSNGLRWPGDPRGSAEDNANCQCTVDFLRGES
jgi:hypothetical protein